MLINTSLKINLSEFSKNRRNEKKQETEYILAVMIIAQRRSK